MNSSFGSRFLLLPFGICFLLFATGQAKNVSVHEQVHLSLGTNEKEMMVTWVTIHHVDGAVFAKFGLDQTLDQEVQGETTHFKSHKTSFYTHRALMKDLRPNSTYFYSVGSNSSGWTKIYKFRTLQSGHEWTPKFAVYGDLGYQNEKSLPYLSKDVENDMYDVIFHIGDFAYDLHERNGEQGHDFMRSIQKVTDRVPYMTCPGNHERHANFSHYDARFSMINNRQKSKKDSSLSQQINNHFHSMDIGPAHILLFSTEYYYYSTYEEVERQFKYLEEDLYQANKSRAERPWIIVMGHRPLYCLKLGDDSCDHIRMERPAIREGIQSKSMFRSSRLMFGLEELFFRYGVDIQIYGHEHFYGRLFPIYNFTMMNGQNKSNPYENAQAPLHIITGSAGNRELHPVFNPLLKNWVANHFYDYGYTRLLFQSKEHIVLEQISDDQGGEVLDRIDIIKNTPHPAWML